MSEMNEKQLEMMEETIKELEEEREEGKKNEWIKWTALSTAIIAVIAAIATLQSNLYTTEALLLKNSSILATAQASDQWSYYQAKGIKGNVYEVQLEVQKQNSPGSKLARDFEKKVTKYKDEQKEISDKAKELEEKAKKYGEESASNMRHHTGFALSEVLFQIAIALSSVAAMTKRRELWYLGLVLGTIGVLFFGDGFFTFLPIKGAE